MILYILPRILLCVHSNTGSLTQVRWRDHVSGPVIVWIKLAKSNKLHVTHISYRANSSCGGSCESASLFMGASEGHKERCDQTDVFVQVNVTISVHNIISTHFLPIKLHRYLLWYIINKGKLEWCLKMKRWQFSARDSKRWIRCFCENDGSIDSSGRLEFKVGSRQEWCSRGEV